MRTATETPTATAVIRAIEAHGDFALFDGPVPQNVILLENEAGLHACVAHRGSQFMVAFTQRPAAEAFARAEGLALAFVPLPFAVCVAARKPLPVVGLAIVDGEGERLVFLR